MTDMVANVLHKMIRRDAAKPWRLFQNPRARDRVLGKFNPPLDDVRPVGGAEQGMKVLTEMNLMVDDHDDFLKSLGPRVDVP